MTDLTPYNTLRVSAIAKKFLELNGVEDLPTEPALLLGHGANVLFVKPQIDFVIKNNLKGKKILKEADGEIWLEVASGENWIDFVNWTVDHGWSGIENLAYIPGTVGAAAVGNIAAYGQTVSDVIESVVLQDDVLIKALCQFKYRDSIFNHELKDRFVTAVTFKLYKTARFSTDYYSRYESLKAYLPANPTPKSVAEAVTRLRKEKLPDWTKVGTAGSFFKNPNVTLEKYRQLTKEIKDLQSYPPNKLSYHPDSPDHPDLIKVPAGRLLEELGWRGKKIGNVATSEKHALIVINCGGATGLEILDFTRQMSADIKSHFAIDLESEVRII